MAQEIHVGDIGTTFLATMKDGDTVVNISGGDPLQLCFSKPDSTTITRTATIVSAVAGTMKYVTVDGDLDIDGNWSVQAKVGLPTGTWYSDLTDFIVHKNICS